MAKLSILSGATSQSVNLFIQNSTTGAPLTGLVFNTFGLTAYFSFAGANAGSAAITLATLAAVNSVWSSGGFKEIDATNMPGIYRLDLPNAVLAASMGRSVVVYLQGVANMSPCVAEIELTAVNNQDGVRFGMTAVPNAAANAANGLPTNGTGAGQISLSSGGTTLAATGLNAIPVTDPGAGPAATFPNMMVQLWRRFFKKSVLDTNAGTLTTFQDNGTSAETTQSATNTGGVQTLGTAS